MNGGIDQQVQDRILAAKGNPQNLQQGVQNQDLISLLAMQKLKSELQEKERQMALQMQTNPQTIKQQREAELLELSKNDILKQQGSLMQAQNQKLQQQQQQNPANTGIAQVAAPNMANFAMGGVVGYQEGGRIELPELSDKAHADIKYLIDQGESIDTIKAALAKHPDRNKLLQYAVDYKLGRAERPVATPREQEMEAERIARKKRLAAPPRQGVAAEYANRALEGTSGFGSQNLLRQQGSSAPKPSVTKEDITTQNVSPQQAAGTPDALTWAVDKSKQEFERDPLAEQRAGQQQLMGQMGYTPEEIGKQRQFEDARQQQLQRGIQGDVGGANRMITGLAGLAQGKGYSTSIAAENERRRLQNIDTYGQMKEGELGIANLRRGPSAQAAQQAMSMYTNAEDARTRALGNVTQAGAEQSRALTSQQRMRLDADIANAQNEVSKLQIAAQSATYDKNRAAEVYRGLQSTKAGIVEAIYKQYPEMGMLAEQLIRAKTPEKVNQIKEQMKALDAIVANKIFSQTEQIDRIAKIVAPQAGLNIPDASLFGTPKPQ